MNTVILAEKPSQAAAYAGALNKASRKDGYYEVQDSIFDGETYITYGFGHLVELAPPNVYNDKWERWSLEHLPIFPENYIFQVGKDKKKQFNIVAGLLKKADTIIIATDSDREGENIAWSIIEQAKALNKNKEYKRLWINSLENEAIREGFNNLRDGMEFFPYYQEAQARQISDWLVGMNASPLYSLNLQNKGVQGAFSVGRVQTPTLYMIYQRQQDIEKFKKTPFFEIESKVKSQGIEFKGTLVPYKRFLKEDEVNVHLKENEVIKGTQKGKIIKVEEKTKQTASPSLFSLSSLQSKVNQQYKASASDTLKAVQNLYEAKLLTYPRTDTPYITENEFDYLRDNLESYKRFLGIENEETPNIQPKNKYVNNSKVQEHHAIVLTKRTPSDETFNKLSDLEKKIYVLVAKTTVAMFLKEYTYNETIIETMVGKLTFKSQGKVPEIIGWKVLFNAEEKEEKQELLPPVNEGDPVEIDVFEVAKETQPPKHFTEGTLITAMKTAGKTVDDDEAQALLKEIEGIGTEATRANIIETLKNKEYVKIEKNKMTVTEKGQILCEAVESQKLLTSAEMTAKWESYLKKIGKQEGDKLTFLGYIKKFIEKIIEEVPNDIEKLDMSDYESNKKKALVKDTAGECPKCSSPVIAKKGFYGCSDYPKCKFTLSDNFRKRKLTKTNIKDLLQNKETKVSNIKKANGDTYNAMIKLNTNGYMELVKFIK